MTTATEVIVNVDKLAERALGYLSGAAVSALVCLGDQLGLYRALADAGAVTSGELAANVDLDERWVREWLHGQAAAGLVNRPMGASNSAASRPRSWPTKTTRPSWRRIRSSVLPLPALGAPSRVLSDRARHALQRTRP